MIRIQFLASFLTILSFLYAPYAHAQATQNISLVGNLTYSQDASDIWGYVDNNGTEYALVGIRNGLSIVSLSNPANPTELFFIPGANTFWRDIKTHEAYAYVTNEGGNGLLIVDLTNLPASINYKDTLIGGLNTAHNIYIDNGTAYVVGADVGNGGIMMLDLSDPWYPEIEGSYTQAYVHDVYVRNNLAYSAEINNGRLRILDITNKTNPQVIGSRTYANPLTHNAWLSDDSQTCFTTDELSQAYVYAWDVSDPANIQERDRFRSSQSQGGAVPHNVHVLNDYLIISYYKDGIVIVDAAEPSSMVEVGYYDTAPTLAGGGTDGCWGAYPFLPSGLILASDINNGLFVLQPNYQRACYLQGTITDSVTGQTISGVNVTIQGPNLTEITGATGEYSLGTANGGAYTVTYAISGYTSKTISTTLTNGTLVTQNVALAPIANSSLTITVLDGQTGLPLKNAQISATAQTAFFSYTTDLNGQVNDPNFPSEPATFIVGLWGYQPIEIQRSISPSNNNVLIYLQPGYYDDFLFNLGWSTSANATTGYWVKSAPIGTDFNGNPINPDEDITTDRGTHAYITGNSGGAAGSDDIDNGSVVLTSPTIDLSSYSDPIITYARWFANDGGNGSPLDDDMIVELSNGSTIVTVNTISGPNENEWKMDTIIVSEYLAPSNNMFLRFTATDRGVGHLVEGGVDLFQVTEYTEAQCGRDIFEPNQKPMDASPIPIEGVLQNARICDDSDEDWYSFIVGDDTNLQIALSDFSVDLELELYDINQNLIGSSVNPEGQDESIVFNNAGLGDTYLIRVYGYNGAYEDAPYYLQLQRRNTPFASVVRPSGSIKGGVFSVPNASIHLNVMSDIFDRSFHVYPNPSNGTFNLFIQVTNNQLAQLSIFDLQGKELVQQQIEVQSGNNEKGIRLPLLPKGMYLLKVKTAEGTYSKKLQIN